MLSTIYHGVRSRCLYSERDGTESHKCNPAIIQKWISRAASIVRNASSFSEDFSSIQKTNEYPYCQVDLIHDIPTQLFKQHHANGQQVLWDSKWALRGNQLDPLTSHTGGMESVGKGLVHIKHLTTTLQQSCCSWRESVSHILTRSARNLVGNNPQGWPGTQWPSCKRCWDCGKCWICEGSCEDCQRTHTRSWQKSGNSCGSHHVQELLLQATVASRPLYFV